MNKPMESSGPEKCHFVYMEHGTHVRADWKPRGLCTVTLISLPFFNTPAA
jgi:hypothetical protein